ncbi:hypothetical protein, partial [Tepidiforma sp.]|uniref:hypothetical protein n=1 Tax=Tepidiforma sp. TaxID=2682230 RepID=UPI002620F94B
ALRPAEPGGDKKLVRRLADVLLNGRGAIPEEVAWVAVMDRVGGYLDYLALLGAARDYDDVLAWMQAEAEARAIRRLRGE